MIAAYGSRRSKRFCILNLETKKQNFAIIFHMICSAPNSFIATRTIWHYIIVVPDTKQKFSLCSVQKFVLFTASENIRRALDNIIFSIQLIWSTEMMKSQLKMNGLPMRKKEYFSVFRYRKSYVTDDECQCWQFDHSHIHTLFFSDALPTETLFEN